jgi:hypothetical protein
MSLTRQLFRFSGLVIKDMINGVLQMMKKRETQPKQKRIEDLTLRELDMIYSLVRVGDWPDSDIARRHRILESDVRKVVESYVEIRRKLPLA